jgi:hypothetical protein
MIIDINYRRPDGSTGRYRKDAQVQTMTAARAEERRLLALIAQHGAPHEPTAPPTNGTVPTARRRRTCAYPPAPDRPAGAPEMIELYCMRGGAFTILTRSKPAWAGGRSDVLPRAAAQRLQGLAE